MNVLPVAAATTFVRGDVDASGSVATNDMVLYAKFLSGMVNLQIDRADIDGNGVADAQDYAYLTAYNYGSALPIYAPLYGTWPVNVTVNDMTATNEGTRTYVKHTYAGYGTVGNVSYTLTVNNAPGGQFPGNVGTVNVLPTTLTDYRVTASPYSPIVEVGCYHKNTGSFVYNGTGSIVGADKVATHTHVMHNGTNFVYENGDEQAAIRVHEATGATHIYPIIQAHISNEFVNPLVGGQQYDYAMLKIDTSKELLPNATSITISPPLNFTTSYGAFELVTPTNTLVNELASYYGTSNKYVAMMGYPQSTENNPNVNISSNGILCTEIGTAVKPSDIYSALANFNMILFTDIFTSGGNSGSPIMYDANRNGNFLDDRKQVAILSGAITSCASSGPRVTIHSLKFFYNNSNY